MRQEAVVNNPGAVLAPGIRTLTRTSPTADPITTDVAAVTFQATMMVVPEKVRWSLDNVLQGDATGSNFTWNFSWDISAVDDGTYLVGARAFNKFDASGTTRTLTVVLNRFAPRAPTGFVAGRNGSIGVEFEWNPNTERDVSGYRVYRVAGAAPSAADTLVCTTQTTDRLPTSCRDTGAPAAAAAPLYYYVVAVAPACPPATGVERARGPRSSNQTYLVSDGNGAAELAGGTYGDVAGRRHGCAHLELSRHSACPRSRRYRPLLPDLSRRRELWRPLRPYGLEHRARLRRYGPAEPTATPLSRWTASLPSTHATDQ